MCRREGHLSRQNVAQGQMGCPNENCLLRCRSPNDLPKSRIYIILTFLADKSPVDYSPSPQYVHVPFFFLLRSSNCMDLAVGVVFVVRRNGIVWLVRRMRVSLSVCGEMIRPLITMRSVDSCVVSVTTISW